MEKVQTAPASAQLETLGRGLILLGAFVSFVLSVALWFTGHHDQAMFSALIRKNKG